MEVAVWTDGGQSAASVRRAGRMGRGITSWAPRAGTTKAIDHSRMWREDSSYTAAGWHMTRPSMPGGTLLSTRADGQTLETGHRFRWQPEMQHTYWRCLIEVRLMERKTIQKYDGPGATPSTDNRDFSTDRRFLVFSRALLLFAHASLATHRHVGVSVRPECRGQRGRQSTAVTIVPTRHIALAAAFTTAFTGITTAVPTLVATTLIIVIPTIPVAGQAGANLTPRSELRYCDTAPIEAPQPQAFMAAP